MKPLRLTYLLIRTPLTSIKGAMDYLSVKLSMREFDEGRDILVFFEMIKKNADRLIRLVSNFLDYERIELGAFEMNFRKINLERRYPHVPWRICVRYVAISRLHETNAAAAIRAGADCVAAVSAICAASDPLEASRSLHAVIRSTLILPPQI